MVLRISPKIFLLINMKAGDRGCISFEVMGSRAVEQQSAHALRLLGTSTWYADPLHFVDTSTNADGNQSRSPRSTRGCDGTEQAPLTPPAAALASAFRQKVAPVDILAVYAYIIFRAGSDPQGRRASGGRPIDSLSNAVGIFRC